MFVILVLMWVGCSCFGVCLWLLCVTVVFRITDDGLFWWVLIYVALICAWFDLCYLLSFDGFLFVMLLCCLPVGCSFDCFGFL